MIYTFSVFAVLWLLVLSLIFEEIQVTIARRFHLFPFRTEKLSFVTPMVLRTSGRVGSRRFSFPGPFRVGDFFCLLAMPLPLLFRSRPFSGPLLPVLLPHLSCLTAVCLYSAYQGWSSPVCKGTSCFILKSRLIHGSRQLYCRRFAGPAEILHRVRIMACPDVGDMLCILCFWRLVPWFYEAVFYVFVILISYILIREWKNSRIAWYILWILNLFFSYMCFYSPIL